MVATDVWVPIVTLVLGWLGSELTADRRDRRALERETRVHELGRERAKEELRTDFQREALLGVQDAAARLGRAAGMRHHRDLMAYRERGVAWGTDMDPESDALGFAATGDFNKFVPRLLDDELREAADAFHRTTIAVTMARSEAAAASAFRTMLEAAEEFQARLGAALRGLY